MRPFASATIQSSRVLASRGPWIMITREGVTLTWQHAGERFQLDQPGANFTETLYAARLIAQPASRPPRLPALNRQGGR
jgi:hypothetical protein